MADFWDKYRVESIVTGDPANCTRNENVMHIKMADFALRHRNLHEALYQLKKSGPVWDGDVISKGYRDQLVEIGACAKVIVKGEDGYNACTYLGRSLLDIYDWLFGEMGKKFEDARRASDPDADADPLEDRLTGRASFLRARGEVKSPELMETAAAHLSRTQRSSEERA